MSIGVNQLFSALLNNLKLKKPSFFWNNIETVKKVLKVLKNEGFISHFCVKDRKVKIFLKNLPTGVFNYCSSKQSKQLRLKSLSNKKLWKLSPNYRLLLLSTVEGILCERVAKRKLLGGVILGTISF